MLSSSHISRFLRLKIWALLKNVALFIKNVTCVLVYIIGKYAYQWYYTQQKCLYIVYLINKYERKKTLISYWRIYVIYLSIYLFIYTYNKIGCVCVCVCECALLRENGSTYSYQISYEDSRIFECV